MFLENHLKFKPRATDQLVLQLALNATFIHNLAESILKYCKHSEYFVMSNDILSYEC